MTKAVRKVARKKKVFLLFGYRLAAKLHALRMMYSIASALKPMAAFRSVLGSPFNVFINTLYVASRVEKPVIPIIVGIWPTAMLIAEPVMKAEMAVSEMNSTNHPSLARPMKQTIEPAIRASADATCQP